jgi:hypothetical protein
MLTVELRSRRYRGLELIVSVTPLVPALESGLQFVQAKPGDRRSDEQACDREWSHPDLLEGALPAPNRLHTYFSGVVKVRLRAAL